MAIGVSGLNKSAEVSKKIQPSCLAGLKFEKVIVMEILKLSRSCTYTVYNDYRDSLRFTQKFATTAAGWIVSFWEGWGSAIPNELHTKQIWSTFWGLRWACRLLPLIGCSGWRSDCRCSRAVKWRFKHLGDCAGCCGDLWSQLRN